MSCSSCVANDKRQLVLLLVVGLAFGRVLVWQNLTHRATALTLLLTKVGRGRQ
jgi:hypothetical protein